MTIETKARVWRIQGDLQIDGPARVEAFITHDIVDGGTVLGTSNAVPNAVVSRVVDETEAAKTVKVGTKTCTRGELLNAITALALVWQTEDQEAAAAAAAAAAANSEAA